ncbi:ABC transporter permease [Gordonia crocea]|uniref:Multidrug ABC transporter permease n=1 Tax=Gordonia crocea TaxID=589162 RepID=A0A7I9UXZ5_9ACTN|nr:ABC transporter permease [Gordonia crocea]GED98077.1 multidrug ABC transporter permease [Gordonia crocea]
MSTDTAPAFEPGVFAPAPRPAPVASMIAAQSALELRLLLRNGEQLLLTMFIPITLLIGLCLIPLSTDAGDSPSARAHTFLPVILAVAIMSTAFTGQAIAVGFDRRYGALKRLGATAIPRWGIIAGKSIAVLIVVLAQMVLLSGIAAVFGWRPNAGGMGYAAVAIVLGTVMFAALGLALGGTGKAEVVLAAANLIWFVLAGFASLVVLGSRVPDGARTFARGTPSGALADALREAGEGRFALPAFLVLAVWAVLGTAAAVKWFRFD